MNYRSTHRAYRGSRTRVGRLLAPNVHGLVKGSGSAACLVSGQLCAVPVLLIAQDESAWSKKLYPIVGKRLVPSQDRLDFRKHGNIGVPVGKMNLPNILYSTDHRPVDPSIGP